MLRVVIGSVLSSVITALVTLGVVAVVQPRPAEAQTRTLSAQQFQLVGPDGKVRAILGPATTGGVVLELRDEREQRRTVLGLTGDGLAYLGFWDPQDRQRMAVRSDTDGFSNVVFLAADGTPRSVYMMGADGTPDLYMRGSDGRIIWSAP